ncbi:hypothetical protein DRJ19_02095 [Candidatus Woesearchaeota archaeon]|mgnify:CR=1 FL=1|nr:MAG: hypothetical protein DRJ19_02095 [Candidatus Woesearchaeota archaeon]
MKKVRKPPEELVEKFKYMCEVLGGRIEEKVSHEFELVFVRCVLEEPRMVHIDIIKDVMNIFVEPPIFHGKWSAGFSYPLEKSTSIGSALFEKGTSASVKAKVEQLTLHYDGTVSIEGTIPSFKEYQEWLRKLERKVFGI